MTVTLKSAKAAFLKNGWRLDHTSKKYGRMSSHYFTRFEGPTGKRRFVRVRVSDHELGETIYGEPQTGGADIDLVTHHFSDKVTAADLVEIARSEITREAYSILGYGYAPSTDPEEWAEAIEEAEEQV